MPKKLKKIVLEEHFTTPAIAAYATDVVKMVDPQFSEYVRPRLLDFEELRLEDMERSGIDLCVLSANAPGVQLEPDAQKAVANAITVNDLLAEQVSRHPTRFAGFAHLPLQNPAEAAHELERCVRDLGMKGALINGHTNGAYLDDPQFYPVWERAEALDVPLYLHPADPVEVPATIVGYPEMFGPGFAWAPETAGHVLRIVYGGIFDRFPKSTLVIGHMGETLPYSLWRLDSRYAMMKHRNVIQKKPSDYIRSNVMITTSGVFSAEPLTCAIQALGADRIMFSVDYPYERTEEAVEFIESAPMSDQDREQICFGNAERLLKL